MTKLAASIILATYCPDKIRYELCKRSFSEISQTGLSRNWYELIIIDNGGIHRDLIEELGADLIITNDENMGQAAALKQGIAISKSPNIVLMDDDLSYRKGWLAAGVKMVNYYPEAVISLRHDFDPKQKRVIEKTRRGHMVSDRAGGIWIMRRRIYDLVGEFGQDYYDWGGLWTRNMKRQGIQFVISKTPYIFHIGEGKSIVRKMRGGKWKIPKKKKH